MIAERCRRNVACTCQGCGVWVAAALARHAGTVVAEKGGSRDQFIFDPACPVVSGQEMSELGFGGLRWLVVFGDGRRVVTNNLSHLGEVPPWFWEWFPVNAMLSLAVPHTP